MDDELYKAMSRISDIAELSRALTDARRSAEAMADGAAATALDRAEAELKVKSAAQKIMDMLSKTGAVGTTTPPYATGGVVPAPKPGYARTTSTWTAGDDLTTWTPLNETPDDPRRGDPVPKFDEQWQPLCDNCMIIHGVDQDKCIKLGYVHIKEEQCSYCLGHIFTGVYVCTPLDAVPYPHEPSNGATAYTKWVDTSRDEPYDDGGTLAPGITDLTRPTLVLDTTDGPHTFTGHVGSPPPLPPIGTIRRGGIQFR